MSASKSTLRRALGRAARLLPLAALAAGMATTPAAMADWDGSVYGTIAGMDSIANEANNYELRVYVTGATTYCKSAPAVASGFAYLNSADVNYKGTLATLLMAYGTGKAVTIYMMNDGNSGCHIHYVAIR